MFDIGFPELLIISIVALLVFGPERLPEVLRTVGGWLGSARRSFTTLKAELEKEVGADEIRRDLRNSQIMEEARQLQRQVSASKDEVEELLGKRYTALKEDERSHADAGDDAETQGEQGDTSPTASLPADTPVAPSEALHEERAEVRAEARAEVRAEVRPEVRSEAAPAAVAAPDRTAGGHPQQSVGGTPGGATNDKTDGTADGTSDGTSDGTTSGATEVAAGGSARDEAGDDDAPSAPRKGPDSRQ